MDLPSKQGFPLACRKSFTHTNMDQYKSNHRIKRGFGHGRKGDRSRYYTITEAILANGKVLNLDQHQSYVGRAGLAAGLHEMFSQNNLAVITKIKFELNLKAEESLRLLIRIPHRDHISEYVDALSQLKAEGTVDSFPHIGNEFRVLGMFETFNFQKWSPETGVPGDDLQTLLNSRKITPWSGVMVIAGNRKVALAKARALAAGAILIMVGLLV